MSRHETPGMEFMPTNDVFHHILLLMRLHKDKDRLVELFRLGGLNVSKSKIKAWQTKSGAPNPDYRPMPREALDAFIDALHESRLLEP